jgi:hypothetical protein
MVYLRTQTNSAPYEKKRTQKILLVDDEPDILEIVGYKEG